MRAGGLGESLTREMPRSKLKWVLLLNAVLLLFCGVAGALSLFVAAGLVLYGRHLLLQRLGGTGDTAGALLEIVECAVLVAAASFLL